MLLEQTSPRNTILRMDECAGKSLWSFYTDSTHWIPSPMVDNVYFSYISVVFILHLYETEVSLYNIIWTVRL